MSDPTPGTPDQPDPGLPDPSPATGGDETVRVAVQPEVAWNAPEPPRAMPWATSAEQAPPVAPPPPLTPPADPASAAEGSGGAPATAIGVLSAATVGWVTPPPVPVATGRPGWVIASVGARFGAYLLDGIIASAIFIAAAIPVVILAGDRLGSGVLVETAYYIAILGFYFLYFVGFWTSNGKATPGMRVFKLQVANAADGKRLAIGPAVIRWLGIGYFFGLFSVIPALAGVAVLASLVWPIVLLVSTATNPIHQGLHDRWARSVVVRPERAGTTSGVWVATCLIAVLIIGLLFLVPIVALILMGDALSNILSAVGSSI